MPHPPRLLTLNGETLPLQEWSVRLGISAETLRHRLNTLGWSEKKALTTPPDRRFRNGGRPRAAVPRPVPVLRRHVGSGQAFVRWRTGGRELARYMGSWGTTTARDNYRRFAAEWVAGAFELPAHAPGAPSSVAELVIGWITRARREYTKGGRLTSEFSNQRGAMRPLNDLYGASLAAEFDVAKLRAVRAEMVRLGWCRRTCNAYTRRIVQMFGWAVGQGAIPPAVVAALREVEPLKAGREAPDRPKVKPVSEETVATTIPHLSTRPARRAMLAAMIHFQQLTGARPGEVCAMRPQDIDRTADLWVYTVPDLSNKNLHRDKPQRYFLGPKAQAELTPYMSGPADRSVFKPSRNGYALAVRVACRRAGIEPWHPHQLRHALATRVARESRSLDKAAALIGDSPATAERYYVHVSPEDLSRAEWARTHG